MYSEIVQGLAKVSTWVMIPSVDMTFGILTADRHTPQKIRICFKGLAGYLPPASRLRGIVSSVSALGNGRPRLGRFGLGLGGPRKVRDQFCVFIWTSCGQEIQHLSAI